MYATILSKPFLAWFLFGKPYCWHQWHGNDTLQLYIKAKFYENNHDKIRNTTPWTWAILLASELKYPLEFRPVMERNTKTSQTGLYIGGHYKCQAIARLVQAQKSVCTALNELTWSLTWHLWNTDGAAAAAVSSVTQGFDLNEQVLFWRQLKLHGRPVGLDYAASSVPVLTIHNLRGRKWVSEMQLVCAN